MLTIRFLGVMRVYCAEREIKIEARSGNELLTFIEKKYQLKPSLLANSVIFLNKDKVSVKDFREATLKEDDYVEILAPPGGG